MNYGSILKQAIDLHVHIGPEVIDRRFDLARLLDYESGKLKGVAVKNHFFATVAFSRPFARRRYPFIIDSVTLNHYSGGLNPYIIQAAAALSPRPIIVWFPTINSRNSLSKSRYEIPEEWFSRQVTRKMYLRAANSIEGLSVLDDHGQISKETVSVLEAIKDCEAILATGHLSWSETVRLIEFAKQKIGLEKIIITHPVYQGINMPLKIQKKLAGQGALIEQCYSMHSIDRISVRKIFQQIRAVGAENCLLSSDVGQSSSLSPSEALTKFIGLLMKEGLTEREARVMLVKNPGELLGMIRTLA